MRAIVAAAVLAAALALADGFSPAAVPRCRGRRAVPLRAATDPSPKDTNVKDADAKPSADVTGKQLSESTLAGMQEEITSPFRGLRFFVYGAGFLGGGVGFLTALSQLAAGVSGVEGAPEVAKSATNAAIDFAVVAAAIAGWRFDSKQREQKIGALEDVETRNRGKVTDDAATAKLAALRELNVMLSIADADVPEGFSAPEGAVGLKAKVDDLLGKASSSVVVFASTSGERVKEALVKAQILGEQEFLNKNVLIVPVELEKLRRAARGAAGASTEKKGFGATSPVWMEQGYVAPPAPGTEKAWLEYVEQEIADAEAQGAVNPAKEGIAICLRKNKTVSRRGLGVPLWEDVINELNK